MSIKKSFLFFMLIIFVNAHSEENYEQIVEKCLKIWSTIDLIKAIDVDDKGIYHYCNQMIDDVLILYAHVYNFFQYKQHTNLDSQQLNYVLDLITAVKKNCAEVTHVSPLSLAEQYLANISFTINLILDKLFIYSTNFAKN